MSVNAGFITYEDSNGNINMEFNTGNKFDKYPLSSTLILRHDILRKAMLTCLGLLNYSKSYSVISYFHAILKDICSNLYTCGDLKIKEINNSFRKNLINFSEKYLFLKIMWKSFYCVVVR